MLWNPMLSQAEHLAQVLNRWQREELELLASDSKSVFSPPRGRENRWGPWKPRLGCTDAAEVSRAAVRNLSSLLGDLPPQQKRPAVGTRRRAESLQRAPQVPGTASGPSPKLTPGLGLVLAESEPRWS